MKRANLVKLFLTIPVLIFSVIALYPLIWVFMQSFKTEQEFLTSIWAIPEAFQFKNFESAWFHGYFSTYYKNSVLVSFFSIILGLFVTSMAGYVFARLRFRGKKLLFSLLIAVLLIPSPVFLLPVYFIVRDLGWLNSYQGLIGPYVAGMIPLGVLIMSNFFKDISNDLMEAAKIDGCSHFGIFYKIMLPLTKPALATLSILFFMNVWNEYMWALISLSDKDLYTIPIGMAKMSAQKFMYGNTVVFAGIVISTIPVLIVFLSLQKYFIRAITDGSVKG